MAVTEPQAQPAQEVAQEVPAPVAPVAPVPPVEGQEAAQEDGEAKPEKVKRGRPVYAVAPVAALPKRNHAGGGLHTRDLRTIYQPLLSAVVQQPENWFQIVAFTSTTGARSAAKALAKACEDGTFPIEGGEFIFDSRRNVPVIDAEGNAETNEDGTPKVTPSVLYARFNYPGERGKDGELLPAPAATPAT